MGSKAEYEANKAKRRAMDDERSEAQKRDEKMQAQMETVLNGLAAFFAGDAGIFVKVDNDGDMYVRFQS